MKKLLSICLIIGVSLFSLNSASAMNKAELVNALASKSGLSKRDANQAVNLMLAEIKAAVARGERVMLPEFGTFSPQSSADKTKGALFIPDSSFGNAMKVRPSVKRRENNEE